MDYSVCLLAAGKGTRTKLDYNKVFYRFEDGQTVLEKSLSIFLQDQDCKQIVILCAQEEIEEMKSYVCDDRITVAIGGATRQDSVYQGLLRVNQEHVFIHDGARPFLKAKQIEDLKEKLKECDACLLMVPSVDTIKQVRNGIVEKSLDRSLLYNAQTPQCFKTSLIKDCHEKANQEHVQATDDTQLVELFSKHKVHVVIGDASNIKITVPSDLKG